MINILKDMINILKDSVVEHNDIYIICISTHFSYEDVTMYMIRDLHASKHLQKTFASAPRHVWTTRDASFCFGTGVSARASDCRMGSWETGKMGKQ